jgi:cobalt-zinc-cadmium efflux system protein
MTPSAESGRSGATEAAELAACPVVTAHGTPAIPASSKRSGLARLRLVLVLTAGFMVVEVVGGWLSGSLALLADAGHMLTDVGALGLTLLTAWIAQRPADPSKTYGYLRWEILAALVNGASLFGIAGWVVFEAIERLGQPPHIKTGLFLAVAVAGLLVNLASLFLLRDHHQGSLNTRAAYLHILGDVLGSAGAIVAAVIILATGWTLADPIISIGIALLILIGAWRLLRESTDILLEAAPAHVSMAEVQQRMLQVPGVTAVHDLHVWTVTSGVVAMSGHAVVPNLEAHPGVLQEIRAALARLGIGHVTIQLETGNRCEEEDAHTPDRADRHDHVHLGLGHHH